MTGIYRNLWHFIQFLALAIGLTSGAIAGETLKPAPLTQVPIEIINNRVMITVPVAHYSLSLTLDTGASSTALFQSNQYTFNDLSVIGDANIIFPALDKIVQGFKLAPVPITFGAHTYMPDRLLKIDRQPTIGDRLNFKFDGVLGQDFFSTFVVEINRETLTMSLYPAGTNLSKYFRGSLPLYMKGTAPHIKLYNKMPWEKQNQSKEFMLDTGYPGAMVLWGNKHFHLAAKGNDIKALRAENKGIFTSINFKIGMIQFFRTPIFVSPNVPHQAKVRDGLIGSNILIWFHHVIDFPGKRLLLDTGSVNFNQMDGGLYVLNTEAFLIKRFIPESHAASIFVLEEK